METTAPIILEWNILKEAASEIKGALNRRLTKMYRFCTHKITARITSDRALHTYIAQYITLHIHRALHISRIALH